jgi:Ser-Thr-rich glycosyl-phosphatidyl-inositol-anchored membrane family
MSLVLNMFLKGCVITLLFLAPAIAFSQSIGDVRMLHSSVRQGNAAFINWSGGQPAQSVRLELIKEGKSILQIAQTTNSGSYTWHVPKDMPKGYYQVRLSDGTDTVTGETFEIKPRIPIWMVATPIVVLAGIVAILATNPSKDEGMNSQGSSSQSK